MGFLGIGWLESTSERKQRGETFYKEIFPYGKAQEEKINELIKTLFVGIKFENAKYNYIVTKQKMMSIHFNELNEYQMKELIKELNKSFLSNKIDASKYMVLAKYDIKIDEQLNYPSIEELQNELIKQDI